MNEELNSSIEIHDSVLISVERSGKQLTLSLKAYIHKSKGVPGEDPGTGWIQIVVLTIEDGSVEGNFQRTPCDLTNGSLDINGEHMSNTIPIPLDRSGTIVLTLMAMWTGEKLIARGTHISLDLLGEAQYIEQFS